MPKIDKHNSYCLTLCQINLMRNIKIIINQNYSFVQFLGIAGVEEELPEPG